MIIRVCVLLTAAMTSLRAQPATGISATFGAEHSVNRNAAASPYAYGGIGPRGEVQLWHQRDGSLARIGVAGSRARWHSGITEGRSPRETFHGVALKIEYARRIRGEDSATSVHAGLNLVGVSQSVRHEYAGPFARSDYFGFIVVSAGPAFRLQKRWDRGTLANHVTLPLLSSVNYPYSSAGANDNDTFRFATLDRFQALTDELSYRRSRPGTRGIVWRYRLSYLRYRHSDSRSFVQQSIGAELCLPIRR
jgi:hypothetical protein